MVRPLRVRTRRCATKGLRAQRRSFINLWPGQDKDTMNSVDSMFAYYRLPEYVKHADHKQRRPVELDDTNVSGLSREQERLQRINLAKWRGIAKAAARRAGSVPRELPEWERLDSAGRGRFRADWSAAQAMEAALRRGARPGRPGWNEQAERDAVDPTGVLDALEAGNEEEAEARALAAVPLVEAAGMEETTWEQLYARIPPDEMSELRDAFGQLGSGQALPPLADFGALHAAAGRSLSNSSQPRATFEQVRSLFALHGRVLAQALPTSDLAATWRGLTSAEAAFDWTATVWNARLRDDLPESALAAAIAAYSSGGPKRFWEALLAESVFKDESAVHLRAVLSSSGEELEAAEEKVASGWDALGKVLQQRVRRLRASGSGWEEQAVERCFLNPLRELRDGADPADAFGESDGSGEWDGERDRIAELLDQPVLEGVPLSEWLRWEFADAFVVPVRLEEEEVLVTRARKSMELLCTKLGWTGFWGWAMEEHRARNRAHMPLVRGDEGSNEGSLLFLRRLSVLSNVPGHTSSRSPEAVAAEVLALAPGTAGPAAEFVSRGPLERSAGDAAEALALLSERPGGCDTPSEAGSTLARALRDAQAEALVNNLRTLEPGIRAREDGLRLLRLAVGEVNWAVGHLRRRLRANRRRAGEVSRVEFVEGDSKGAWACGTSRTLRWEWKSQARKDSDVASEQRQKTMEEERRELEALRLDDLYFTHKDGKGEDGKKPGIADKVGEILGLVMKQDKGQVEPPEVDEAALGRMQVRLPWATLKRHMEWNNRLKRELQEAELRGDENVHVALFRAADEKVEDRRQEWEELREWEKAAKASKVEEEKRAAEIVRCARAWAVASFRAHAQHASALREEREILDAIDKGELDEMLATGSHLAPDKAAVAGEDWEYCCGLEDSGAFLTPNHGRLRVRLPFRRAPGLERPGFPYSAAEDPWSLSPGKYRVTVLSVGADGAFEASGSSTPFEVQDNLDEVVERALSKAGAFLRPREEGGEKELLAVGQVPNVLEHVRAEIELDLERETRAGAELLYASRSEDEPHVSVQVLKHHLRADVHREAAAEDPVLEFAARHEALQRAGWELKHPGSTLEEWAEHRESELRRCAEEEAGWWAYDADAVNTNPSDPLQPIADPAGDYAARKALALSGTGTAGGRDRNIVVVRYEGMGYLSDIRIDSQALTVAVPVAGSEATQWVEPGESGRDVRFDQAAGRLRVWVNGTETDVRRVVHDSTSGVQTLKLQSGQDEVVVKLPTQDLPLLLARLGAVLQEGGVQHRPWPTVAPMQLSARQLAGLVLEAANGAHSNLCSAAESTNREARVRRALRKVFEYGYADGRTQDSQRRQMQLPTVIRAWADAGAGVEPPTGLVVARRRFDSWQLHSGQGRYDESPVFGEEWQHPVEEGAVQYHYNTLQAPLHAS
eukprot:Hpha_TRINITY_DN10115_c0_g2::TRINITY_DN10115_c0_g2_i1::g.131435::m.131435